MKPTMTKKTEHGAGAYGGMRDPRDLKPNPDNARGVIDEKEFDFLQLVANVKELGVIIPIIVKEKPKGEIIAGHRRHRAALKARLKSVPVVIWHGDAASAAEVALVENACRKDLTPLQEAEAVGALLDLGRTQELVAELMNISVSTVAKLSRLRTLTPAWRKAIKEGKKGFGELTGVSLTVVAMMEPAAQDDFLAEMKGRYDVSSHQIERGASERLMLLAKAPFDVAAEGLNGKVPVCAACPKRASAVPNLFADVAGDAKPGTIPKGDRCLDAVCWRAKHATAISLACQQAAITAGCEGDDPGPVLILDTVSADFAIKAGGKLASRAEHSYNVRDRIVPMKAKGEQPKNSVPAVLVDSATPVWLMKSERTTTDSKGKKTKLKAGTKLTLKQKMEGLELRRRRHAVELLMKYKRVGSAGDASILRLAMCFGVTGSMKAEPNRDFDRIYAAAHTNMERELRASVIAYSPKLIDLAEWAAEEIETGLWKKLKAEADTAIPVPKSWGKQD